MMISSVIRFATSMQCSDHGDDDDDDEVID